MKLREFVESEYVGSTPRGPVSNTHLGTCKDCGFEGLVGKDSLCVVCGQGGDPALGGHKPNEANNEAACPKCVNGQCRRCGEKPEHCHCGKPNEAKIRDYGKQCKCGHDEYEHDEMEQCEQCACEGFRLRTTAYGEAE